MQRRSVYTGRCAGKAQVQEDVTEGVEIPGNQSKRGGGVEILGDMSRSDCVKET